MPNSHFTASVNGTGDYTAIETAWAAFLSGAAGTGIAIQGATLENTVDNPIPVGPPSMSGDGEDSDAIAAIPNFSKEPGVTYRLKFTDDGAASFNETGYEAEPNSNVTHANGWHAGRQYSIFSNDVQGPLSYPL